MSLGIQRLAGVALKAPDPEAAARFAIETLGFSASPMTPPGGVAVVGAGGVDPISLVYLGLEGSGMHHATFIVDEGVGLDALAASLGDAVAERDERKVATVTPGGHRLHFALGPATAVPVAAQAPIPVAVPAPLCSDHVALRVSDLDAEVAFATEKLGMLVSSSVAGVSTTLRFPGRHLARQLVLVAGDPGVEYVQFAFKNVDQFYAAQAAYGDAVTRGPLRVGPGHAITMTVDDPAGYSLAFTVEEEVILDDANYVPRTWQAADAKVADEWATA